MALTMALLCPHSSATAQEAPYRGFFLGVGMGQDVGGLGARATYWVAPYLSGFVGGGWAIVGAAYNAGVEVRIPSERRASFFATGMYGYTGVIYIKGKESLNAIYYGPTMGAGVLLKQRITDNYWRFSVNVPFRSQEMYDAWDAIKKRPDITVSNELLPITIGIGFHFSLR